MTVVREARKAGALFIRERAKPSDLQDPEVCFFHLRKGVREEGREGNGLREKINS